MIIEEIILGEKTQDKQKAIRSNLGKEVVLNDFHNSWLHGVLLKEEEDNEVYQINLFHRTKQLHYHNLKQLLVLTPLQKYK
jgi:hypothetical protein